MQITQGMISNLSIAIIRQTAINFIKNINFPGSVFSETHIRRYVISDELTDPTRKHLMNLVAIKQHEA